MTSLADLIQQGATHAWLFMPSAILLGALHGLEPGHSKTMMAAFIIAVRGTVMQAVLLGLAATLSHTLVVWAVALIGLHYASSFNAETSEPYFQVASAVAIIVIALWMAWRTWSEARREPAHGGDHDHDHTHEHGHHHGGDATRRVDTGHGVLALELFEDGVPPRWRVRGVSGQSWLAGGVTLETLRPDGSSQIFTFADRGSYLESSDEIPEPHEFTARLNLGHGDHTHSYDLAFTEDGHAHGLDVSHGAEDAHALAHAQDIRSRFASRNVTTAQIVMFGLTGGLIPCPAAITVLLLCLQLKQFTLGVALVLCFSIGLAMTMVSAGVIAALSVQHVARRWSDFSTFAARAPYVSSALIICVGLYVGWQGVQALIAA